jgi:asparagine synthase (glutamine-hydrolysing)
VLTKVDLMSMRVGLEVRSPFLDYRIAELAMRLPASMKIGSGEQKRVVRLATADLLPQELLRRRKQGFDLPVGQWLRRELAPMFRDVVTAERLEGMGLLRPAEVFRMFEEHTERRRDHTWGLWVLLVLTTWWYSPRRHQAPRLDRTSVVATGR